MRAVVCDRYGPPEVLRLAEVEQPVPRDDEVRIKVRATTVNRSDCGIRAPHPWFGRLLYGLPRPRSRILGSEVAGDIDAVGAAVREFAVGDRVFGINAWRFGAHAEYVCMRESAALAPMPAGATYEQAGAVCDGVLLALMCLRAASVGQGTRILIYGASGSIGTAGVQLSSYFGADVTAVCNTKNVALVHSLGAGHVIDYTREDFTKNGETYDVIFDAVGMHSFRRSKGSLKPGGAYVPTDHLWNLVRVVWTSRIGDKRVLFPIPPRFDKKDVMLLKGLMEAGKYRAVIDRTYPLEQVVEATRYVESKQKTGNVVLTL